MAKGIAKLELKGFEEVTRVFETLEPKLQKKALRPALRAGAKVIQKDAKRRAHKRSGLNARWIKVKSLKRSRKSIGVSIQTGTREQLGIPASDRGYYPFSEEFGTRTNAPHPYMKPALVTKREEATKAVGDELGKRQNKIIAGMKKVR